MTLNFAFGIGGIDLWEGLGPVGEREKSSNTGLVVTEQDETGSHDQGNLGHRQCVPAEKRHS